MQCTMHAMAAALLALRGLAFLPLSKKVSKEVSLRGTPSAHAPARDCGSPLRIPFPHFRKQGRIFQFLLYWNSHILPFNCHSERSEESFRRIWGL